jgi:hypothetical protein
MRRTTCTLALLLLPLSLAAQADTLRLAAVPLGRTTCEAGRPVTHYADSLPPNVRAQIEAHEAVHRDQLATDCEAALARITASPEALLLAEAPAYCAQMRVALQQYAADPRVYWQQLTRALWRHFDGRFTPFEIVSALHVPGGCPPIPF